MQPSLSDLASFYGPSFHILAKSGYDGNGCGANEQGIKVPLEHNTHEASFRLGYNPSKPTKASKRASLNVNAIFNSDDNLTSIKPSSTSFNTYPPHKEILVMNKSLYESSIEILIPLMRLYLLLILKSLLLGIRL